MVGRRKRRPWAKIRKRRLAVFIEIMMIVILVVVLVHLLRALADAPVTIREERLMNEKMEESVQVHVITMQPTATPGPAAWARYPIELDDDLQKYISEKCRAAEVPSCIVAAMIQIESGCDPDKVTDERDGGVSYGLMQINEKWHRQRMWRLGVFDLLDPYQNVDTGIDYLRELMERDKPMEWVLMAYNGGEVYADQMWAEDLVSVYARRVITLSESLLEQVQVVG